MGSKREIIMGWRVGGKVVVVENFAGWQGRGVKRDGGGRIRKTGEHENGWVRAGRSQLRD